MTQVISATDRHAVPCMKQFTSMKNAILILPALVLALLLNGCVSSGLTASSHITNVQITEPNFRVIATNVTGEASSKGIIGMSYGVGIAGTQLALIPLTEERMLYRIAIRNLWTDFESKNGPIANRRLALVNVRYDSESLNLILYTKITTAIVADVVEFE